MKHSLFITGASGFIGKSLLKKINWPGFDRVIVLARDPEKLGFSKPKPDNLSVIRGDLLDQASYRDVLTQVDTVVHLAAVTGKARRGDYFRVNSDGTRHLVECSLRAGVKYFLMLSSIAAKFKKKRRYFYADSKLQAEEILRSSGLQHAIVRPTMVLGSGSPVFSGFSRFAFLPLIPIFGKGNRHVQPVFVDDLAGVICHILESGRFDNRVVEIGGPDKVSIRRFMEAIRHAGKEGKASFLRIPTGPAVFFLSLLEPLFYRLMPITLGQMATFRNDGTADENEIFLKLSPGFKRLDAMIEESLTRGPEKPIDARLERECRVFCRYLVRQPSDVGLLRKYSECHEKVNLAPRNRFDAFLLKQAARGSLLTRWCDAYSRFFYPDAVLRKKLVYLLAVLETSSPYFRFFDQAPKQSKIKVFSSLAFRGAGFALALLTSFFLFLPFKLMLKRKVLDRGAV